MKHTLLTLIAIITGSLTACAITTTWYADSTSSFGLTISGTGGATHSAQLGIDYESPLTSPSGLWAFSGGFQAFPISDERLNITQFTSGMRFVPMGESLSFPPYSDFLPFSVPHDGNRAFIDHHHPLYPWGGHFTIDITSIPDRSRPETWDWVINISGSGPALSTVPDAGSTLGLLGLGLGAIGIWRRRAIR